MREGSIAMFTKRPADINYEFRVSFVLFADAMTSRIPISANMCKLILISPESSQENVQ